MAEYSRQTWPGRRQRNVAKAWKRGVFGLHAGQCVCGLKMNKLIGRTSHRLCTFSTSIREIREIKYYFNIWGIRKKKERRGLRKKVGGVKIHPFHLPWIRACNPCPTQHADLQTVWKALFRRTRNQDVKARETIALSPLVYACPLTTYILVAAKTLRSHVNRQRLYANPDQAKYIIVK